MAYEQRPNSGILFKNDRKKEGSKQPDWKGNLNINGVTVELAAWEREGKRGVFLSLKVDSRSEAHRPPVKNDEDIPF